MLGVHDQVGIPAVAEMPPTQSKLSLGQIALRAKYRVKGTDGYMKVPLKLLGVHCESRSGVFPSAARVQALICHILINGFSSTEANHEGVVVEELPAEHHEAFHQKWGVPYQTFKDYNCSKGGSVSALRPAFSETRQIMFGTLAHSTLVVGLLCLMNGAVWDLSLIHISEPTRPY